MHAIRLRLGAILVALCGAVAFTPALLAQTPPPSTTKPKAAPPATQKPPAKPPAPKPATTAKPVVPAK